jgi:hypothetical protein
MSHLSDNESAQWKKLIEIGIFDDFYPQRLSACFRYLDVDKTQCFSLKVGKYVLPQHQITFVTCALCC